MAKTQIADVIVPEVFNPYIIKRTAEKSGFYRSGIIERDESLDELARSGGRLINLPFWKDLTGDSEVLSDSAALTPAKLTAGQDVAALLMRGKAWSANDLARALSGDDPMRRVGDLVADYWARQWQAILIQSLQGVFADNVANDGEDLVNDIAIEDGNNAADDNLIGAEAVIDSWALLGDAMMDITGLAMHSTVYTRLQKQGLITFEPEFEQDVGFGVYLDKTVIVNDNLPKVAGGTSGYKYTTYLFGRGAVALGEGNAPVPTETDRDSLAGDDVLINRRHFILHPRGIKFTDSSVSGSSPSNSELADAANWDRVYEPKNIRLVKLVTNG